MDVMASLTIIWLILPFMVGFSIYLLPRWNRYFAVAIAALSVLYGCGQFFGWEPFSLTLTDSFGVTLMFDQLTSYFILMNGLVTAAVILYCFDKQKSPFFYTQLVILHGVVNAAFCCADLISLYVALETLGVAAFLLITYPRSDRSLWVGLRYLFVSNTAMLFYLIGTALVYQANHSFAFSGLATAPREAIALIFLGLLTKGGIFISGLWLPLTHGESETPISALFSGVVVKAGVFPLVRCALLVPELEPLVRLFGVGTVLLGVIYAIFEQDTKRLLAFSSISQLGFVLAAPAVGGFYALTHGLVKASLFLTAGQLPSRNFRELCSQSMPRVFWWVLVLACASMSGLPFLAGYSSKILTMQNLLPWQVWVLNIAAVGTAIAFAKFIFLPCQAQPDLQLKPNLYWAIGVLLGSLFVANSFYLEAYQPSNLLKALVTTGAGWLAYGLIFRGLTVKLPRMFEEFEHLIGVMSLVLTGLFWMVLV
ncbi:multisubunit Na+/H+ antiporter, subunit D1 [[Synechococcus] sp. NIES-970]|nr:multisubunit Na+/H+ antiporter, subunit D1 [[Synechococcus] sp. NIES-970]